MSSRSARRTSRVLAELAKLRLAPVDLDAIKFLWGGLESEMGLRSSWEAQMSAIQQSRHALDVAGEERAARRRGPDGRFIVRGEDDEEQPIENGEITARPRRLMQQAPVSFAIVRTLETWGLKNARHGSPARRAWHRLGLLVETPGGAQHARVLWRMYGPADSHAPTTPRHVRTMLETQGEDGRGGALLYAAFEDLTPIAHFTTAAITLADEATKALRIARADEAAARVVAEQARAAPAACVCRSVRHLDPTRYAWITKPPRCLRTETIGADEDAWDVAWTKSVNARHSREDVSPRVALVARLDDLDRRIERAPKARKAELREERAAFVADARRQAEQLLIAACGAYRAVARAHRASELEDEARIHRQRAAVFEHGGGAAALIGAGGEIRKAERLEASARAIRGAP